MRERTKYVTKDGTGEFEFQVQYHTRYSIGRAVLPGPLVASPPIRVQNPDPPGKNWLLLGAGTAILLCEFKSCSFADKGNSTCKKIDNPIF
jgi:hypothetical protein